MHIAASVCPVESILIKHLLFTAVASFDKLKDEIKAALTDGSKLALAVDAWTGINHTKYLGVIAYWIMQWQLKDGLLALLRCNMGATRETNGRRRIYESCYKVQAVRIWSACCSCCCIAPSSTGFKRPPSQTTTAKR